MDRRKNEDTIEADSMDSSRENNSASVSSDNNNWRRAAAAENGDAASSFNYSSRSGFRKGSQFNLSRQTNRDPLNKRQPSVNRTFTRSNQNEPSFGRQPRSMGFMFLENLENNDPEKIMLVLNKERTGFANLFDKELSADVIVLIIKILSKICSSFFSDTKYNILHSSFNEKFVTQLKKFIACLPSEDKFLRRSSGHFWKNPDEFWMNLLIICEDLLHTTPTFACKTLPVILRSLKMYIPLIEQEQEIRVSEVVKNKVEKMLALITTFMKDIEENQKSKEKQTKEESTEPPDDFRNISVYPSPEEIVEGRGFLRENVIKGPYQNVNHYLDVQFRLLREDFVGPLRDGIANYRSNVTTKHVENVKVHKEVQFLNTETINEFYCLRIQFGSKKKKTNFENSKRFMYGSLLCFTKDNFQTLIFGKVAQRKMEDLQKGQVVVAFDEKVDIDYVSPYLMVECSVYFEPYFHVLTVLKNMTEENFPMERYIIRVNSSIQPPEYLTLPNCEYEIENHKFSPLSEWPKENIYNFNESQMIAFKAAITQEISVIQGPPGTGKTYLGLKVAETLLRNIDCWYYKTPMLVICYTNHALDQFLEGLIPVTNRIIRVGGQSKNTNLDVYNLRNKTERDGAVAEKRRQVQDCLREIKHVTENLQQIDFYNSVISFRNFHEVVPEFEDSWFSKAKSDDILLWLLEGANYGQDRSSRRKHIEVLQAQDEFNRIGINDEDELSQTGDEIEDDFNDHIVFKSDSLFEEVLNNMPLSSVHSGRGFFLISLSSIRDQMKLFEVKLLQMKENKNPSFQQLIKEEEMTIQLEDLKHKYDYLKRQLAEGRRLQDSAAYPVDLRRPHKMSFDDRWRLYFYWLNLYKQREADVLRRTCEDFPSVYKQYEELRDIEDVRAMKNAQVVGMTTTSAARLRSSLQTLKNPIVIVEEAAEVLEAHIVTSITKHCKHLILIGDHKQLRPSTANYNMAKEYRLGISLFERMLINNIHCYTLNVQHRMRPEISCLIRPAIYDFLEDHPSVLQRPQITGVDNCIFFVDHDNTEEECDGSSKRNYHEVTFLIYLARHLVLNGYNPENITILAAYLGQYFAFRNEQKAHLDLLTGMKIAVLDNYQGEESDIILLSLVRNNEDNKIGFLSIENRVCVALSRARNGLYIMGNMAQLCSDNKLWRKIKTTLENQGALGAELPLRCQIHQDQITLVKTHTDFFSVPEGGCGKLCDMDLKCGHKCTYLCHIRDRNHMFYKCQTLCNKKFCKKDETHLCKKLCFEDCGSCNYLVQRTLPCGHEVNIPCHIDPETYKCQVSIPHTKLPCGHTTDKPCYCDPETFRCPHICDVQVQPCGHACELLCHFRKDPDHQEYICKKPCARFMKDCSVKQEDHICKKLCYQECDPCTITVRKHRTLCRHVYDVPCNSDVDDFICEKPCAKQLHCGHPCKSRCNEPCQPCQIKVFKTNPICRHSVKVKCCEPPDRKLCAKKCPLKLACGHPCTKKCNEPCTPKCTELVNCDGITAECGHVVTRMECHMASSNVDPKLLVKYCKQPCNAELKCGHRCSGSCGECAQGRVHKRCSETCGTLLVCDHPCDIPCRQACRPCKRTCFYRCQHSICRKSCGEVCTPCRERCSRRCAHQWCVKLCGDICSVPPCKEPCDRLLKCGHECIGFCGDPCPPKCMVCDRDELLEVFFGTESEDARYVLLNDCKHIVENEAMEQWLQQDEYQISYKLCPKCKTAIKTTQRYSDYIKSAIRDVAQVKIKANGRPQDIEEIRKDVVSILRKLNSKCGRIIMFLPRLQELLNNMKMRVQVNKRGRLPNINIYEVQSLKAKVQLIEQVLDICCNENVIVRTPREIFFPQVDFIFIILSRDVDYISNQEIDDLNPEIDRLSRMVEFSCLRNSSQFSHYSTNNQQAINLIKAIQEEVFSYKKFTTEINQRSKDHLKELNNIMSSGLAISDREKKEILQAMGFTKGHWFKCPNGHVYAIGECGGAMEESTCNECGARIGGRHHRLLNDNLVAPEMDGALYGAWPPRANYM